jgi:hypothetical protein
MKILTNCSMYTKATLLSRKYPSIKICCLFCWLCLTKALWKHLLSGYRGQRIKSLHVSFWLAQANGRLCVDFGCTHPIDGLFWSLPIYLLDYFLNIWMLGNWLNRVFISFYFLGCILYHKVSYHYEMQKTIHMTNFFN